MRLSDFDPEAQHMLVTGLRVGAVWCVMQNNLPLVFCLDHGFLTLAAYRISLRCVKLETIEGLQEAVDAMGTALSNRGHVEQSAARIAG